MKKIITSIILAIILFSIQTPQDKVSAAATAKTPQNLVKVSTALIGTPYKFGGTSVKGFDCSGFINYAYANGLGKKLPRTSADMWKVGKAVKSPQVGDLVFFQTYKKGPSHVGIYIGNNSFVHASSSKGVMINKLSDSYYKTRYLGAKKY